MTHNNDRIWFPCIEYRIVTTGELVKYPPQDGTQYTLVIHDLKAFNDLCASGEIYDPRHTGRNVVEIVDNRAAIK